MKIKYDLTDNYVHYYDIANGVLFNLKKVKKKKAEINTFRNTALINFVMFEFMAILIFFISYLMEFKITLILGIVLIILSLLYLIISYYMFNLSVKSPINSKSGTLEINKTGIVDKCDVGKASRFKYDSIDCLVITKELFVFIMKSKKEIVFIKNSDKRKFIKAIKDNSNLDIYELKK